MINHVLLVQEALEKAAQEKKEDLDKQEKKE